MHQEQFSISPQMNDVVENSLGIWFNPDVTPFEVTLFLDTDIVVFFERKPIVKNQKLYKKPDGTAELVLKITDKRELFAILRYWLPNVRVLEPVALQEELERMMQKYLNY